MKFRIIASIFALASVGIAAPSNDAVRMEQASAAYEKITSYKRTPATLNKRGPCPEAGSGEIDPCCFDGGPDENCRSRSNCYTRCGPSGPADHGGPGGCVAGCATVCPSTAEC